MYKAKQASDSASPKKTVARIKAITQRKALSFVFFFFSFSLIVTSDLSRGVDHNYKSNFSKRNTVLVIQKGDVRILKMARAQRRKSGPLSCPYSDICQKTLVGPQSDLSADACLLSSASCS